MPIDLDYESKVQPPSPPRRSIPVFNPRLAVDLLHVLIGFTVLVLLLLGVTLSLAWLLY